MTARNYDYILTVSNSQAFVNSNTLIGVTSKTTGLIVNVNHSANTLKIRLANADQEFTVGETLYSNAVVVSGGIASNTYSGLDGATNTFALPTFSGISTYSKDSVTVYMNGVKVPGSMWTIYNNTNVRFKPFYYTKVNSSETSNLKVKLNETLKSAFFNPTVWTAGNEIPDLDSVVIYNSTIVNDFSWVIPDNSLTTYITGSQSDVDNNTLYNITLPIVNSNTNVSVSFGDVNTAPYYSTLRFGEATTASADIVSIDNSVFIESKNAFQQQPLVRLYTLYFPGEWYPPKESGNPDTTTLGINYPWPQGFPVRFAEIRGDYISDITYAVQFGGQRYTPYPLNSTGISLDSSGKINDVTFVISNFDNLITQLIENSYLCGYNSTNNSPGIVNGEVVYNIDPRTNPANVYYNASYAEQNGTNVAWTYETTTAIGDTWVKLKHDTRDLLGGVVEIKTTFAHLLDYWPEYSVVLEKINSNYIKMRTISPYRVGDIIHNDGNNMVNASAVITQIVPPYLVVNNAIHLNPGDKIYIQNPDATSDEFILDTFKINSLEGLDDQAAKFSLTSWLQYFKNVSPRRSFLKNACVWDYRGDECQYPRSGTGTIPGSTKTANGFFTLNNQTTTDPTLDVCAKNPVACDLRRNGIHYGGFPGTGVAVPR
jgi:phage-related protein